ncbi:cupin domain-containing protein [Paenibacillus doosanensis]|uniref:Cupin domain protein n=1 Tax=Paenibacillus konkukensis TaxID=2020716 RepID=A0ABY4RIH8_9BACL|nr:MULTISPECIES: cupin domain-containing protein [Paenibacillus]MCS7464001.1 cupin domain-containing protein [Paenibacillus doosanensis]UQZ81404.1 Cupin domain protein [Paenibacillus konkukensis]
MEKTVYQPVVSKYKDVKPFEMDQGVLFHDMMIQEMGPKTIIVGLATFEPGKSLPCHIHNVEESVTILKGNAFCDVEGVRTALEPYDTSFIPAFIPHRFVNASDTEELIILWAYSQVDESLKHVDVERIIVETDRCMLPKNRP